MTVESTLHLLLTSEQHRVDDILCFFWVCSEALSANDNNPCCEASHHGNFDSTGHDVLCECALLLFFSPFPEQTMCIPPVADQDLHVTLSEARIQEDGHQARIVRSQQLTNQTVNLPQHTELGQILWEVCDSRYIPIRRI